MPPKPHKSQITRLLQKNPGLAFLIGAVVVVVAGYLLTATAQVVTKATPTKSADPDPPKAITTPTELTGELQRRLRGADFGVAAKNLNTGEVYVLDEYKTFDAASTMKLLIVAYMYHEASNNQFDLDEVLTIPSGEVQRYGTGSIQYQKGPYKYSYRELAKLMMRESDNTAAYILAKKLDNKDLQQFANKQLMGRTTLSDNTTCAADLIVLTERIYTNQVADAELTKELLSITQYTDFEDRIPAKLPKQTTVYHKTGDAFDGGLHDAGIVVSGDKKYVVAIMTRGIAPVEKGAPKIAAASRDIFTYMTR